MLLLRISLVLLASSTTLYIATSIPLSETSQRHIIPHPKEVEPTPEVKSFEPNTLIHGVPDGFFSTPPEFYEDKNFGLWPSGHTVPERTVLLNDGEARFYATFTLVLRRGEELKGMRHRPNDTSIITSVEESRERHVGHLIMYNITITHHFRGTVGVAEYELTILTTTGATLRTTGIYHVSGVEIYASVDYKPLKIVSGITAPPLSVESLYSFSHMMKNGQVKLPLKFQQVGPDAKRKTVSLLDVLSTAKITVLNMPSNDVPILINEGHKCNMMDKRISIRRKGRSGSRNCDVSFDYDSMSLVLRLHPERYGKAIIELEFPSLRTDTLSFKTEIRLKISKPAIRRPELIMKENVHLQFDYYGTESFFLQLKNMNVSKHKREVLNYVLDLPGNRYAIADFAGSSLAGSIQNISFTVVAPGQENKMLQEKIQRALMANTDSHSGHKNGHASLVNIRLMESRENESDLFQARRETKSTGIRPLGVSSFAFYDDVINNNYSKDFEVISVSRHQENTYEYRSHVHAVFPNLDDLVTARIPSMSVLETSFASKKAAMIEALRVQTDSQNLLVKVILLRYTSSTFTQHKSLQISKSLSEEVSLLFRTSIQSATLVMLEDKGLNVEATYHVLVPEKYTDAVMDLKRHKTNISSSIAGNVVLRDGRIMISEVVRLAVLEKPTSMNITVIEERPRYKGVSGTLVTVVVIVSAIIAIPLLLVCIGYVLARRYGGEESSNFDGYARRDASPKEEKAIPSREEPQPTSDVLQDNYGRVEEDSYESSKVRTEMANQGYFEDKVSSAEDAPKPSANS